jgi:hypothetical protein
MQGRVSNIRVAAGKGVFFLDVGDFLDEFYRADNDEKEEILLDPPAASPDGVFYFAYLAAVVHNLANKYGIDVPDWVWDKRGYLANPYFGGHAKGNLRLYFMYKSPPEFKHRNLFVDPNELMRV